MLLMMPVEHSSPNNMMELSSQQHSYPILLLKHSTNGVPWNRKPLEYITQLLNGIITYKEPILLSGMIINLSYDSLMSRMQIIK